MSQQFQQFPTPQRAKAKPFGWLALSIAAAATLAVGSCSGFTLGAAAGGATAGEPGATVTVTAPAKPGPTTTVTAPGKPGKEKTVTAKPEPQPTVTVTETAPPEEEPAEEPSGLGDGMWEVGVDVEAGRWKTVVPDDSFNCYWARHKDDSGEFRSIIANGNHDAGERVSITIKKGEFLELNGCGDAWERVS